MLGFFAIPTHCTLVEGCFRKCFPMSVGRHGLVL